MAGDSAGVVLVDGNAPNQNLAEVTSDNRLAVDVGGQVVDVRMQPVPPSSLADLLSAPLIDGGGSADLRVDGSTTPVEFVFNADPARDIKLFELRLVIASDNVLFQGDKFIDGPALTNGVNIQIRSNNNSVDLATVKRSEDLLALPLATFEKNLGGPKDYFVASVQFGLVIGLVGGSGDFVKVIVQDDLSGPQQIKFFFQASVSGVKV